MVSRGYVPSDTRIPSPDMSFVRLLEDGATGWQQRGQYAIWTGARALGEPRFRLLERVKGRVAVIEASTAGLVLHKVAAGVAFNIENLMGYWLSTDTDAMWLDLPNARGQYAILAIGGTADKPARAQVDCPCPKCGAALNPRSISIAPLKFNSLLEEADAWVAEFNADPQRRTCPNCGDVHPTTYGLIRGQAHPPLAAG
jgi:hypothetical protein